MGRGLLTPLTTPGPRLVTSAVPHREGSRNPAARTRDPRRHGRVLARRHRFKRLDVKLEAVLDLRRRLWVAAEPSSTRPDEAPRPMAEPLPDFERPADRDQELADKPGVVRFLSLPERRFVMIDGEGPAGRSQLAAAPRRAGRVRPAGHALCCLGAGSPTAPEEWLAFGPHSVHRSCLGWRLGCRPSVPGAPCRLRGGGQHQSRRASSILLGSVGNALQHIAPGRRVGRRIDARPGQGHRGLEHRRVRVLGVGGLRELH